MAEQDRKSTTTTTRRGGSTVASVARTTRDDATKATESTSRPDVTDATVTPTSPPVTPALPAPSPRNGVAVGVGAVADAFSTGNASQSVTYVQHILAQRGFTPGNTRGVADHETRVAYARYQQSVGEPPTGLPTAFSLDYLGFDVVG